MRLLKTITRKELLHFYLASEQVKKGKQIPPIDDPLIWTNPNLLDGWLKRHQYKFGAISGFKQWAYVEISKDDLINSAIVNSIFKHTSHRLGDLKDTREFRDWIPNKNPLPIWYKSLSVGEFDKKFAIIIRMACNSERKNGAKFYIEDGSGRAICYLKSILESKKESEMIGNLGFDPDPRSNFLQEELDYEFSKNNCDKYSSFEKCIKKQ